MRIGGLQHAQVLERLVDGARTRRMTVGVQRHRGQPLGQ